MSVVTDLLLTLWFPNMFCDPWGCNSCCKTWPLMTILNIVHMHNATFKEFICDSCFFIDSDKLHL